MAELLYDIDRFAKAPCRTVARAEQREVEPEIVTRETDRLDQVRVVGEDDRHLAVLSEGVDQQV
jgi:hypothetical protein